MDIQSTDGREARFAADVEGLVRVIGHADRAGPLADYRLGLIGLDNAGRAQQRRADGGGNGAGPDGRAAPVAAPFRRPVALVGRKGIG